MEDMTRTVDSPLPNTKIEPRDELNLCGAVVVNQLVQKDIDELPTEAERWTTCTVSGTYIDGESTQKMTKRGTYHSPEGQKINKNDRYVILNIRNAGMKMPIEESRFENLVEKGVLHKL